MSAAFVLLTLVTIGVVSWIGYVSAREKSSRGLRARAHGLAAIEDTTHGHQAADMRAVALENTEVVPIAPDVVRHLFEGSPRLTRETGHTIEVSTLTMRFAT